MVRNIDKVIKSQYNYTNKIEIYIYVKQISFKKIIILLTTAQDLGMFITDDGCFAVLQRLCSIR